MLVPLLLDLTKFQKGLGFSWITRVRQIFFTKLVPGQVACKSHLPRRMRWLSHVTDGTSAAEIILHHLVVINKDMTFDLHCV